MKKMIGLCLKNNMGIERKRVICLANGQISIE